MKNITSNFPNTQVEVIMKNHHQKNLTNVFQNTLKYFSSDSFIAENGWFFILDVDGKVLSNKKIGFPDFSLRPFYEVENLGQEWKPEEVRTVFIPIREESFLFGYLGLAVSSKVSHEESLAFLEGFRYTLNFGWESHFNEKLASIVSEMNESFELNHVLSLVVTRISQALEGKPCVAAIFDREQRKIQLGWSSDEIALSFLKNRLSNQNEILYDKLLTAFDKNKEVTQTVLYSCEDWMELGDISLTKDSYLIIFPILHGGSTLGIITVFCEEGQGLFEFEKLFIMNLLKEVASALNKILSVLRIDRDYQKRDRLYEITKKIHSTIDVNEVLHAIVENTKVMYPELQAELWLSHDSCSTQLPVKQFTFHSDESEVSVQAYMEARTIVKKSLEERTMTLAAPLRGKQGVYGVIEFHAPDPITLQKKDIEYISMLADTAGTAFENAQLYSQSRNLIRELLLINEITQQLNKSLKLKDVLKFVTGKLIETYKAEYCCILRKTGERERDPFIVQASTDENHLGQTVGKRWTKLLNLYKKAEPIIVADLPTGEGEPLFRGYHAFVGVPLINGDTVEGAILVMDSRASFFTFDDYKLLEILAQHMNLAMVNASLHAEVERMVVIDNLTGLYNRKYLYDYVQASQANDEYGSLILIDIDYFKNVNDTYGHQVGDEILIQVADILHDSIRSSDVATRWGGEELAIYLPRVKINKTHEIAERIRKRVMERTRPQVTVSSGLSFWNRNDRNISVEHLFQCADEALYEAKSVGRNKIILASVDKG